MVCGRGKDTFTFEGTVVEGPMLAYLAEPFLISVILQGTSARRNRGVFYAFTDIARKAWEELLPGDRIATEGVIFRKIKPPPTHRYAESDLCLRLLKFTLVGSKVDGPERDSLLATRAFLEHVAPDGRGPGVRRAGGKRDKGSG